MKCWADQTINTEKSAVQCRVYGENFLDWIEAAFSYELARTYATFRRAERLQEFYDGMRDEIVSRMERNTLDNMYVQDPRRGRRMAEEWEMHVESVTDALFAAERALRDYGFPDPEWKLMRPEPDGYYRTEADRSRGDLREQYYTLYGRNAALLWTGSNLLWLAGQEFSTGKAIYSVKTLYERVYLPYAAKYRSYAGRFLSGRVGADRRNRAELHDMVNWFKRECRIDIGSLGSVPPEERPDASAVPDPVGKVLSPGERAVYARPGAVQAVQEGADAVREMYEKILSDVQRGRIGK